MEDLSLSLPFDPYQTHQRHFDCICDPNDIAYKYIVSGELEVLAQMQDVVFASPALPVLDSEGNQITASVVGMRAGKESYRDNFPLEIMFLARATEKEVNVCEWYPVCDNGTEVEVTLSAIHEWANGMEATLEGSMMNGTREVVFFDTRYAFKKLDYRIGETYKFKLGAFAYCIEMLDNPKMKLTAEQAEDFAKRTGLEIKRYANGKARPMSIDMCDMVACISRGGAQPDNCEFQSTIRGISKGSCAHEECLVLRIACARDDDGRDIEIPLVCRRNFFSRPWPRVGKCVRGILWMQGYCV